MEEVAEKKQEEANPFEGMHVRFRLKFDTSGKKITVENPQGQVIYDVKRWIWAGVVKFFRANSENPAFELKRKGAWSNQSIIVDSFSEQTVCRIQPRLNRSVYDFVIWDDVDAQLGIVTLFQRSKYNDILAQVREMTGAKGWFATYGAYRRILREKPELVQQLSTQFGDYLEFRSESELLLKYSKNLQGLEITCYEPAYARHVNDRVAVALSYYVWTALRQSSGG